RWALAARRRRLLRDAVLLGLLVLTAGLVASGLREALAVPLRALVAGVLAAWLVVATEWWVTRYFVLERRLTDGRFRPEDVPDADGRRVRERLRVVAERPRGNLMVFSDYSPFAGSGVPVGDWSFSVDAGQGAQDDKGGRKTPRPFDASELHEVLARSVQRLGLPNLRVDERLFVSGVSVQYDERLVPDRLA